MKRRLIALLLAGVLFSQSFTVAVYAETDFAATEEQIFFIDTIPEVNEEEEVSVSAEVQDATNDKVEEISENIDNGTGEQQTDHEAVSDAFSEVEENTDSMTEQEDTSIIDSKEVFDEVDYFEEVPEESLDELLKDEILRAEATEYSISNNVKYTYTVSGNEATITGYDKSYSSSANFTIPASIGGYKVTKIDSYAFENSNMGSLTIPTSITSIGYRAFYNCQRLSVIYFNAYDCKNCDSGTFYNAGYLTGSVQVIFGSGVRRIPANLFNAGSSEQYARVTSVTMSNSIQEIGSAAFAQCYILSNMIWSSGIVTIGSYAFENCTKLTSVTIPVPTTSIGYRAFYNCQNLSSVNFNASNCKNCDSGTFYNVGYSANSLKVTFGSGVKRIPANLFNAGSSEQYARVTSVVMSNAIQEIGSAAFCQCYNLSNVTWGTGIVMFESYAFENCTKLTSVTIPSPTTNIGYRAFYNCQSLSSVYFNAMNCDNCDSGTFYNAGHSAGSLKVIFGSGVKRIPANLFHVSTEYNFGDGVYAHVTDVVMSNSIQEIGESAFDRCFDLINMTWGTGIITIRNYAFAECFKLSALTIPVPTTSIGYKAFYNCQSLSSINYNALNCNNCDSETFYNAGHLAKTLNVSVGAEVKRIPDSLFYVCEDYNYGDGFYAHITSVNLPSGLLEIGNSSFRNCYDLKTITFYSRSTNIAYNAFYNCFTSMTFKCYRESTADNHAKEIGVKRSYLDLAAPKLSKISNVSGGVKTTWNKVSGAEKYRVFRRTASGKWTTICNTTAASFTDKTVKSGTKYFYTVRCITGDGKSYTSGYDTKGLAIVYVAVPSFTSVKNNTSKAATAYWKKNSAATGYQIQYSTSSTFASGNKTVTVGKSTLSKKIASLKKGKKYYFRIRAYKTVSGKKYYSAWSAKKNLKIGK